jgi:uncharacterized protein
MTCCSLVLFDSNRSLAQLTLPFAPSSTLIVFDFDLTLSHLPIIVTSRGTKARSIKAELRGGDETLRQLRAWHTAGARFAILTAKVDSTSGVQSVIQRLRQLGIDSFFRTTPTEANVRMEASAKAARIRAAAVGDVIGSGHNKPEAFWLFAQADPTIAAERKHVVYVEDCADHILNFEHAFQRIRGTAEPTSASSSSASSPAAAAAAAADDVLGAIDGKLFAGIDDAILCYWPPPREDGFETFERHSADAHDKVSSRSRAPSTLLSSACNALNAVQLPGVYVFSSLPAGTDLSGLPVVSTIVEPEGLSVIAREDEAVARGWKVLFRAAWIQFGLATALEGVGLTAAVSTALGGVTPKPISCNIVAGAYHDHVFVPIERAAEALEVINRIDLGGKTSGL